MNRSSSSELAGVAELGTAKRLCTDDNVVEMETVGFLDNSLLKPCKNCHQSGVISKEVERGEFTINYTAGLIHSYESDEFTAHSNSEKVKQLHMDLDIARQRQDQLLALDWLPIIGPLD
ncbi:hypothetical protein HNY73_007823 [Argiope bruennichi]|uniref:Uncharacterized protein n=1 Tax=Argiope bruennichi TaxID=94029 RepID=A0A8T0FG34_ARGBR|nr:hypothetical protein HNY73_007823 [Argiope bruennichi]